MAQAQATAPDKATPGKEKPAADGESKVIILQPGSREQKIDVKPQNEAMATLAKGSRTERSALVDKIKAAPQKYAPPVFFSLAYVLWERGDKDDAVFWYVFGIVRGRFDTMRCADLSAQDAVGVMRMNFGERVGEDFFKYLKADEVRSKKLFLAAIDADRKTPYDYDHRWINLHGLGAVAGALGDKSQPPESLPKDQWPDLAEKNRQHFIEGQARQESPTGLGSPKEFFDQPAVVALAEAVEQGNLPEIDRLVAAGADVNAIGSRSKQSDAREQFSLLTWAMRAKQKKSFKRLLEHKADPNGQFQGGASVTSIAAANRENSDWLEMALAHGANPNLVNPSDGITARKTPLFDSIDGEGSLKNLELLIKAGADLNARDKFQRTPAVEAADSGEFEMVIQLLSAGADFRLRDKDGHDVIYHIINRFGWENTDEQRVKLVSLLREKGADFSAAEKEVAKTDPAAYADWKKFLDEHPAGKPAR
jgi:ankyrin repeat protein